MTVHFNKKEWNFYSLLLECFPVNGHTAKHFVETWNIYEKIHAFTTVNALNIISSVKFSGWSHSTCSAHSLILVIQNSLKEVDIVRNKVKRIVEYFHRSTQSNNTFLSNQKQMNSGTKPLKLKTDVPTKWN